MKKIYILLLACIVLASCIAFFTRDKQPSHRAPIAEAKGGGEEEEEEEDDRYDGPGIKDQMDFDQMKDPALGYVPYTRLKSAIEYTNILKQHGTARLSLLWQERGPIYDSVGPSNGNTRGGNLYTSGRMAAVLVDTLNDPTGNTVIIGGISGGIWRCTNFLSTVPDWRNVFDYFDNMAISSLCQDPSNPSVMYFSTGEATSNADAHFGQGVWKSIDKGVSWTFLPATVNFIRNFKILCDPLGNIYLAARTTATPALQTNGLMRSSDGGLTWINITPTLVGTATLTATCTDIELSNTGKLYASFGYSTGGTATVRPYVTTTPTTVTQATGWTLGVGVRATASAGRLELACLDDIVYGITSNAANIADSCYKSVDGGLTWVKTNTVIMPTGIGNGQAWYDLTLSINPENSHELMAGGLDAYRSLNDGATWTRQTFWVTTVPYVHADHHYMGWWKKGNESRIVIGCDGGIYYSNDGGLSWLDKNRNLGLKQFYAAAIHPAAGSPYLLAGAQDNGTHQLKNPGNSYSIEVTGGDGMYCYINQLDPNIQFGSYVYNQYRRTVNGGQTWTAVNLNTGTGLFANPFDYDDAQNIMYACFSANNILRWPNANTANVSNTLAVPLLAGGQAGGIKVSPYTLNRVYLGGTSGKIVRVDNANAAATFTDITGTGMPAGTIKCINVGSSDNFLVATFTNFGVNNVWYSSNGGTSWTAIDGNLPDMPVWWALFDPSNDNRMILATETGVWTTELVNGAATVWEVNPGLPTTRIAMLRMRTSDRTVVASTYGRGLFTAVFPGAVPQVNYVLSSSSVTEQSEVTTGCRSYRDYQVNVGIVNTPVGDANVTVNIQGGTAVRGVDYDFTTNGNFTTPSTQIVFPNGATGPAQLKPVTVRVYDDAEVESPETIILGLTVSGTTNANAGPVNTHTLTINDNDRFPIAYTSSNFTIGTNNVDLTSLNTPFDGTKLKHRIQLIYRASELNAAGITTAAKLSSMTIRVKTKNTTQPFRNLNVSIANWGATNNLTAGFVISVPFQTVYSGNYTTAAGANTFNFSSPFAWDGTSNIVIQMCYDNTGFTAEGVTDVVEGMTAPFGTGIRASTYSNFTTATAPGCYLAAGFVDDNRVNATFAANFGEPVATALNSTKTEYLTSNTDLFYYTSSNEILARVLNLSNHDYGCTQVVIDRAGTGASQFWNTNTANYLMNKTFRILPTTNNATGKYEVTFYFTKAEKDGWEAATGQTWSNIQLIKLPSRISNVTPLNAQPDGPGTIKVVNPVGRTYGPVYYTLSFLLEDGFSGYGFGIPGRMNTILTLTGASNPNNRDVDLSWTTSVEINATYFEVEKSNDGTNFRKIGQVQSSFNKLTPSTYGFVDRENTQFNYYRIKMLHTDGYILYSNVVFIQRDNAPNQIIVTPNPFTSIVTIRFTRTPQGPVSIAFFDMAGKLISKHSFPTGQPSYDINTEGILSRGIYMIRAYADGKQIAKKVRKD